MTKQELLQELAQETCIALQPSGIHGIGVFAITGIPAGCHTIFSKSSGGWIELSFTEVEQLPAHVKGIIETYFLFDEEKYFLPDHGCKVMDMANYLNHSSEPNISSENEGDYFVALRDIKKGEELFVDYGEIVSGVEGYQ